MGAYVWHGAYRGRRAKAWHWAYGMTGADKWHWADGETGGQFRITLRYRTRGESGVGSRGAVSAAMSSLG
eukprot:359814-Chlamydomonas_euryale.AAC.13